jgi:hypothetical protein
MEIKYTIKGLSQKIGPSLEAIPKLDIGRRIFYICTTLPYTKCFIDVIPNIHIISFNYSLAKNHSCQDFIFTTLMYCF